MKTISLPHIPQAGDRASLAIQCTCPDSGETGSFLYIGSHYHNPGQSGRRCSPVYPSLVELFPAVRAAGWHEETAGNSGNGYTFRPRPCRDQWTVSDLANAKYLGPIELETACGGGMFEIMTAPDRLIFGGACNTGFLESGYILREDGESDSNLLAELLADLEAYYSDGPQAVSRIIHNQRL